MAEPKSSANTSPKTPSKKSEPKSSQKIIAWAIGGIVLVVAFVAIAIGIASNSNGSADRADKDTLIVESGKGEEIKTEYYHIDGNKFYVKIPTDFRKLSTEEINKKYSGDVPETVFANADDDVNIAISISDVQVTDDQIEEYLEVMKELLESNSDIITTDFYEVNKHHVATMKVGTEGNNDDAYYNQMMFFSYEDKLVVIAFNCDLDDRGTWENVGDFIINSLYFER